MNASRFLMIPVAGLALCVGAGVSAQTIQDFTGSVATDGVFGDFTATPGAAGLAISSPTDDGGTFLGFVPGLIFPNNADHLFIRAKLGANNTAPLFRVVLLDEDGAGTGEAYLYDVDTSLLNTSTFTTVDLGALSGFDGGPNGAFGRAPGNGVLDLLGTPDDGLYEFQLQSGFTGAPGGFALDATVESVFVDVPEPASLGLLGLGGLALLARRRK